MTKQNVAEPESLGEAMNRTELFFEKNGRKLTYVFLGLLVLAALVYGYRALIVAPRAEKAAEIYMKIAHLPLVNTITDDQMHQLEAHFGVKAREGYLS